MEETKKVKLSERTSDRLYEMIVDEGRYGPGSKLPNENELSQELQVSRQGVYDNLSRAETLLRNMEEKTGCVRRDLQSRKALREITAAAKRLEAHPDTDVKALAQRILTAAQGLEE